MILGHGNPRVIEAIRKQIPNGSIFGTPTEIEIEFAEIITKSVPCIDMVRVTNMELKQPCMLYD